MNHDVILDRYGRLFQLPEVLSLHFDVRPSVLAYRLPLKESDDLNDLSRWHPGSFGFLGCGLFKWLWSNCQAIKANNISVVIASSDCFQIILGSFLSRVTGVRFVADLYDNYESFGLARVPFMKSLYRGALRRADGISVVSETLGEFILESYPDAKVVLIESAVDTSVFVPNDKHAGRQRFGLPDNHCIGVCGGLNKLHDIETVIDAFASLEKLRPDITLVLAGAAGDISIPNTVNVISLGQVSHELMPELYSSLDIALIPMSDTEFGRYAFPQKAYEILGCRVPVIAANVGSLGRLFSRFPSLTYTPGDSVELAQKIEKLLENPEVADIDVPSWRVQGEKLASFIRSLLPPANES